jgi:DNA-binding HxlR family transcriptional regulator
MGRNNDSIKALDEAISNIKKFEKVGVEEDRIGCVKCFRNQLKVMENTKMLLTQLQLIESPIASINDNRSSIGRIDPTQLNSQYLNPLASETRLQILISVFLGENRFSDFAKTTGQSGGHLFYHLRILLQNGFITQYESKDYVLTRKGIKALITLAQLNGELTPNQQTLQKLME